MVRGRHAAAAAGFFLGFLVCGAVGAAEIRVEGTCTLIDAILAANADAVSGDCPAGSGADRIVLTSVVQLDSVYEDLDNGPNGLPRILSEVVLDGRNNVIFRAPGADPFRFFEVGPSGILTLDNVILFGGYGDRDGGAVYNDEGFVHLKNSTLWFNEASGEGGAVYNDGSLAAEDSSLLDNTSRFGDGGAVYNTFGSTVSMLRTTLEGNEAQIAGGAMLNESHGTVALSKCTVEGNEAISGGGIANWGNLTVVSSLFSDNEAQSGGGGGLKVYNGFGTEAYIVDSTFSGNKAHSGGAIFSGDSLTVELSTFSGNEADGPLPPIYAGIDADPFSEAWVESTIMANSIGGDHCSELFIDDGLNNFGCHGDEVTGLDATLKDNGGPTETHALYNASNAIDAAGACDIPADQRGIPREGDCDSGAFEYGECVDFVLRDEQVTTHRPLSICEYFWLGPGLNVWGPSGHLRATVGKKIIIRNGFSVRQDGQLTITIDPDLLPP
ncbi:MAG: hypothetical protein GY769_19055 [bacterium]|nr:hypothetical protein [bacterium]